MNRLLLLKSRTAQDMLECRYLERIAALPTPLHFHKSQQTQCTAQNTNLIARNLPSTADYLKERNNPSSFPLRRPSARSEATYLILSANLQMFHPEQHMVV
jgi:hypothetical protein